MQLFKSYIESIKGQSILQTNEILPLFALPYVNAPDQHPSFQELFTVCHRFSSQWPCFSIINISRFSGSMASTITNEIRKFSRMDFFWSIFTESCCFASKWWTSFTNVNTIQWKKWSIRNSDEKNDTTNETFDWWLRQFDQWVREKRLEITWWHVVQV